MDPLTHALLGGSAAHLLLGPRAGFRPWLVGAVGGLLPDADILISSQTDPLLAIQYHRHFTHALLAIPVGGALASLPWLVRTRQRRDGPVERDWRPILLAGVAGYATHGMLDACTNYGTHLLWPFSDIRSAWHWITTIGPLFTLALLAGLVLGVRRARRWPTALGLAFAGAYVSLAVWSSGLASEAQARLALTRGHPVERAVVLPTVGNPVIWRSMYLSGETLYFDRVRVHGGVAWKPGSQTLLVRPEVLPDTLCADMTVMRDFRRFSYFSDAWLARSSSQPDVIGDARYSLSTERFEPIWGVRFHPGAPSVTEWVDNTVRNRVPLSALWREIIGQDPAYQALP